MKIADLTFTLHCITQQRILHKHYFLRANVWRTLLHRKYTWAGKNVRIRNKQEQVWESILKFFWQVLSNIWYIWYQILIHLRSENIALQKETNIADIKGQVQNRKKIFSGWVGPPKRPGISLFLNSSFSCSYIVLSENQNLKCAWPMFCLLYISNLLELWLLAFCPTKISLARQSWEKTDVSCYHCQPPGSAGRHFLKQEETKLFSKNWQTFKFKMLFWKKWQNQCFPLLARVGRDTNDVWKWQLLLCW